MIFQARHENDFKSKDISRESAFILECTRDTNNDQTGPKSSAWTMSAPTRKLHAYQRNSKAGDLVWVPQVHCVHIHLLEGVIPQLHCTNNVGIEHIGHAAKGQFQNI